MQANLNLVGIYEAFRQQKEYKRLNLLAVLVGIVAGYGAIAFRHILGFFQNAIFHKQFGTQLISPLEHSHDWLVIFIPPIGFLIVSQLVHYFAREAKGHGVPSLYRLIVFPGPYSASCISQ